MRTVLLTSTLLVLPFLSDAVSAAPVPVVQTPEDQEFRKKFEQAMRIGSRDEMKKLVDRHTEQAVNWIILTAEAISRSPNETLYERMAALRKAWKASIGTEFCEEMERYFSLMDSTIKRERAKLRSGYEDANQEYYANLEEQNDGVWEKLAAMFKSLAIAFEEIGDKYYASQCWGFVGTLNDEGLRGSKDADLKEACRGFIESMEAREEIGLKDRYYVEAKSRVERLVALGFGPESEEGKGGGESGAAAGPVAAEAAAPISTELTFELVEEVDEYERPSYYTDEIYPAWNSISLGAKESSSRIPRVENGPNVLRAGSAEVWIDLNQDGEGTEEGDVEIPIRGRLEPVVYEIGEGESRRKVAYLTRTGIEQDTYQKIEMNLAPVDAVMTIYILAAGSVVGEIDGTSIRIIDENLDGVYGSAPLTYGHVGMTGGRFQPEMDSMVIDEADHAVPFSEYTKIEDQWYRLEVQNGGTSLLAHPVELKTGVLKLDYEGRKPEPQFVIVKGQSDFENSYFDLTTDREVEVPVGRYELYFGLVSEGKKKQLMKAVMVPGEDTPIWQVLEGDEVDVELGSPFGFDFETVVEERTVLVEGTTVCVVGRGGERYERIWNAVPRPEVSVRSAGSRRGSRAEEMEGALDQDTVYEQGWETAWFPLDLEIEHREGADAEVQLVEKRNELFGKIESEWK